MPRITWPLTDGRPTFEVFLTAPDSDRLVSRVLLSDTGAGTSDGPFALVLDDDDCLLFSRRRGGIVSLAGAYDGSFRTYLVRVQIPALDFSRLLSAVAVDRTPPGLAGIAAFGFLSRIHDGNFGDPLVFGLEA